jgi:hypothetical protein
MRISRDRVASAPIVRIGQGEAVFRPKGGQGAGGHDQRRRSNEMFIFSFGAWP